MTAAQTVTITPDTTLYIVLSQEAAGYTLLDRILGNQAAGTYAEASEGKTEDENAEELCLWLETMARDGALFVTEEDAETARGQMERGHHWRIESFTARSVHRDILRAAARERPLIVHLYEDNAGGLHLWREGEPETLSNLEQAAALRSRFGADAAGWDEWADTWTDRWPVADLMRCVGTSHDNCVHIATWQDGQVQMHTQYPGSSAREYLGLPREDEQ